MCNLKNKTKKHKINIKNHGMYLGITYKAAANNVTDLNKEIKRDSNNYTICRIIIGGDNKNFRVVFFNLNEAKMKKQGFISSKIDKIKKQLKLIITIQTNYSIQLTVTIPLPHGTTI